MISRLPLAYLAIMLCSLGVMAMVHFYYIQPTLISQLEAPPGLNVPEKTEENNLDLVEFLNTLDVIKKMAKTKEISAVDRHEKTQRNPFFWPDEIASSTPDAITMLEKKPMLRHKVVKAQTKPKPPKPLPRLSMTIVGSAKEMALINGHFFSRGEKVNGDTLKEIQDSFVILTRETGEDVKVTVGQKTLYGAAVEVNAGKSNQNKTSKRKQQVQQDQTEDPSVDPYIIQQNKKLQQLLMQLNQSR